MNADGQQRDSRRDGTAILNIGMRDLIDLVSESVVHRDRLDGTIVAINPSKLEWDRIFKTGAAGVFCKDGTVVIGQGPMLAHDVIMELASVDQSLEKHRLQMTKQGAWAELWITKDEWDEPDAPVPSKEDVDAAVKERYGQTLAEIDAEITPALQRFMGGVPFKAIAISANSARPWLDEDANFIDMAIP